MERDLILAWMLGLYSGPAFYEPYSEYSDFLERSESEELITFVRMAVLELRRREVGEDRISGTISRDLRARRIRVTRELRIFVDGRELHIRPMAKSVFLLFLRHPEGITLKDMWDYRDELRSLYSRVSRSDDRDLIEKRMANLLDLCSNELNVNISRVNSALAALIDSTQLQSYTISGRHGAPKSISMDRSLVEWD